MGGGLDANWLRIFGYLVAGAAAVVVGRRERHLARSDLSLWPAFWFLTGGLLFIMALGRATDVGDWISQLGRQQALASGWYAHRRKYQAIVVGSVGAIWFVSVVVALWQVPERRRRYLPAAIVVFSLMCYAGARLVSLHQVDGLLYRRDLGGVKFDAVFELVGLAAAIVAILWALRPSHPAHPGTASSSWTTTRPAVVGNERDIEQLDRRSAPTPASRRVAP